MEIDNLVRKETGDLLEVLDKIDPGIIVQNKAHKKLNLIDITSDPDILLKRIQEGWTVYPGKRNYVLQAPEAVVCDLSEMTPNKTDSLVEIATVYRTINQIGVHKVLQSVLNPYFDGLEVIPNLGGSCESEIRMIGSDKRIFDLPSAIMSYLKTTDEWHHNYQLSARKVKERTIASSDLPINQCEQKTNDLFEKTRKLYDQLGIKGIPDYAVTGPWGNLPECDKYMFVMKSGFKYALGFVEDTGKDDDICLWEYHEGLSYDKELRIGCRDLEGKTVGIIDRSYSGNTLDTLRDDAIKEKANPIVISVFPKSTISLERSDYMIFLDRVVKTELIDKEEGWALRLFEEISRGDESYGNRD
ncbi:MAG: hypothetical protein KKE20_01110 [Nanoarchaeota archaeon]|nr:hypothetical protein [Nanoarchaeota archaeon]